MNKKRESADIHTIDQFAVHERPRRVASSDTPAKLRDITASTHAAMRALAVLTFGDSLTYGTLGGSYESAPYGRILERVLQTQHEYADLQTAGCAVVRRRCASSTPA